MNAYKGLVDGAAAKQTIADLSRMLAPRSVAVLGASDRPGNLGGAAIRSMLRFKFAGDIYPVNPKQVKVAGFKCYASLAELPQTPDVAILAVGADGLLSAIEECASTGITHGIAWAGGFSELGEDGRALQLRLTELCKHHNFQLCGPNCLGIINAKIGFTGTFTSSILSVELFRPSSLAIISQSGGLAGQALGLADRAGFGFNYLISCGNEAVITASDFMHALVQEGDVSAIAVYLESVVDGEKFVAALTEARARSKPVIVLKGGASEASSRATLAHTGRLGGSDRAFDAVLREFGAIRVHSLEELVDTALLIETLKGSYPKGPGLAIATFGGGAGVLAVDQCIASGMDLASIPQETVSRMATLMTPLASLNNPIDMTPQSMNDPALRAQVPSALAMLAEAQSVDAILFLCASNSDKEPEMAAVITALRDCTDKPVVASWSLASRNAELLLAASHVYSFPETARATRALGNLVKRSASLQQNIARASSLEPLAFDWSPGFKFTPSPMVLSEHEVADILRKAGLAVAPGMLISGPQDLEAAIVSVPRPWAMKGISSSITHRASAGLVALNIDSRDAAARVLEQFQARAEQRNATLEGVYVAEMVKSGTEVLVSAIAEPTFGVMLTIGAGGNLTELIDDVIMVRAPVTQETALEILDRLRLSGASGSGFGASARQMAAEYISKFSRLAVSAPWDKFTFELNPVKCSAERAVAVDGLLIVESDRHSPRLDQ